MHPPHVIPLFADTKPRSRFRASQENRALSENESKPQPKRPSAGWIDNLPAAAEEPKASEQPKRRQKPRQQQWKNDFTGESRILAPSGPCHQFAPKARTGTRHAGQHMGASERMPADGSGRGDWLHVSMRTPGASREPSFQGSPACSPERETMAHVHDNMPQPLAYNERGMRETTLSCLESGPDNTQMDVDEANPRARFGDDISLDCNNDEPSDQPLHRKPAQLEDPAQSQQQIRNEQFLPSQVATQFVSQGPQPRPCGVPQLPLLGGGHTKMMHPDGSTQLPSLGRGAAHVAGVPHRPSASHRQLQPADQRHVAPSDAVQSCSYQTCSSTHWQEERGAAVPQPHQPPSSVVGLLPPVSHAVPQQSTNDNFGGPPHFQSTSHSCQYAGQRACSDAGFHHGGTVLHDVGRMPGRRKFSVASSFPHTHQQPQYRPHVANVCSLPVCTTSLQFPPLFQGARVIFLA